ncbi:MAG: hypothetical protein IKE33_01365 [Erysipelotrichaceae bacterium]|nr:hypothetical protein [Erysipelotrichaceae bacterium]
MKTSPIKKYFYIIPALFLVALFYYIVSSAPVSGDDWGYALNGTNSNPITMAVYFYNNWSGRFFSELWGFLIAPRKWLFNIINPILFLGIFLCSYTLSASKNVITVCFLLLACILGVNDALRMETYTWIMGSTYVVPLCLSLMYLAIADNMFKKDNYSRVLALVNNILIFIGGMMMENISAAMVFACLVLCIYSFFTKRELLKFFIINLVVAIAAFALMRLSPGSTYRLIRDSSEWNSLPFYIKMANAYPGFLEKSFIENNYMIFFFSFALCTIGTFNKTNNLRFKLINLAINGVAVFAVFSHVLFHTKTILENGSSIFSMIFWPIYILWAFMVIYVSMEPGYDKHKTVFLLMVGGVSAVVMLMSPIYGNRSALYIVYFTMICSALIIDQSEEGKILNVLMVLALILVVAYRSKIFYDKYTLVRQANIVRESEIAYYQDHPEEDEAWFVRYPINTIHGIDIEPDDTYHMETFVEYFGLSQSPDKIFFYFED